MNKKVLLHYIIGGVFVSMGFNALFKGTLSGIFILLGGMLLLPIISNFIEPRLPIWKNKWIKYITSIGLIFLGTGMAPKTKDGRATFTMKEEDWIVEFIKKDKGINIQNLTELQNIGKLYNHSKASKMFEDIRSLIKKENDIFVFNPNLNYDEKTAVLIDDASKGKLQNYLIKYKVDGEEVVPISTILVYTKAGAEEYKENNIPNVKNMIDYKEIEAEKIRVAEREKEEKERKAREEELQKLVDAQKERMEKFREHCLNPYNNTHKGLVEFVKSKMIAPKSFDLQGEGKFGVTDNGKAFVSMTYTGKNAFGVEIQHYVRAEVNPEDCSFRILEAR